MSGFLYLFLGDEFKSAPTDEQLKEMKLDCLMGTCLSQAGYTGSVEIPGRGVICAIAGSKLVEGGIEPRVRYNLEAQEWARGGEKWWIGWEKDSPPGSVDLARENMKSGHEVKMGDGGMWLVPCERFLPNVLLVDEKGDLEYEPLPEFAAMKEKTAILWDEYIGLRKAGENESDKKDEGFSFVAWIETGNHFLAVNYRIGRVEANVLKLWTEQTVVTAIEMILDVPALIKMEEEEREKKKSFQAVVDLADVDEGGV